MTTMRVVLDTNILVTASRSSLEASFALLQALRNRYYRALVSVPLMLEYEVVLLRPEQISASGRGVAQTQNFLDALCCLVDPVDLHYLWRPQLRNPADEMVLETALNGRADVLVTMNISDFSAAADFRLPVMTPVQFLKKLNRRR
ncbi:putative toxin-antitoxin system toxin component, PIN family [Gammaproteobacteria bacterium]